MRTRARVRYHHRGYSISRGPGGLTTMHVDLYVRAELPASSGGRTLWGRQSF
jgi:hypothetical protein